MMLPLSALSSGGPNRLVRRSHVRIVVPVIPLNVEEQARDNRPTAWLARRIRNNAMLITEALLC